MTFEEDLLRELRSPSGARAEVRARVRDRLGAALASPGVGEAPGATDRLPGGELSSAASTAAGGVPAIALVTIGLAVGGMAGATAHAALAPPPETKIVYLERRVERQSPPRVMALPPAPSAVEALSSQPRTPMSAARTPSASPPAAAEPPAVAAVDERPGELDPDVALLDRARRALAGGDPARARALLQEHSRTFPKSLLTQEREALEIKALIASGQRDLAVTRASEFERRYPKSMLLDSIENALGKVP